MINPITIPLFFRLFEGIQGSFNSEKDNLGKFITKYAIHFCVEKGLVEIKYNAKDNDPPLLLYTGAKWNVRHFERNVEKIIVEFMEGGIVYIIIEKLQ